MSTNITPKTKINKETGSVWDTTDIANIKGRAGSHDYVPKGKIDVSAFSLSKSLKRQLPKDFIKKNTGNGGTQSSLSSPIKSTKALSNDIFKNRAAATVSRSNPPNTELRRFYERGDLPIQIDHGGVANRLAWKVEIQKLDFHHYLPIFFDGIRENEMPYSFVAEQGVLDMLEAAPHKVLPVIPQLIIPIKTALNTRDRGIIAKILQILQVLVRCDRGITNGGGGLVGQALVPYYRQLLPIFNIYINNTANLGDKIDYSQRKQKSLGDLVTKTLEELELSGGDDAFINIKYIIPIYQSARI